MNARVIAPVGDAFKSISWVIAVFSGRATCGDAGTIESQLESETGACGSNGTQCEGASKIGYNSGFFGLSCVLLP
jgi:hypothetical protein